MNTGQGFAVEPAVLRILLLAAALGLVAALPARAADPIQDLIDKFKPVICSNQTYGLCAGASGFVFNDIAHARCDVKHGRSISSPFPYDDGKDICSLNAEGAGNGYMASTFSLPDSVRAPRGTQAVYVCPRTSRAAYAKCDGAVCFTSTSGHSFPGSDTPLAQDEIICSCPIEKATARQGLEIIGPYPCQKDFFSVCDSAVATGANGSTLYDGTSIGSTFVGATILDGRIPHLNICR
ncbi:MAG: hypothetical protein U1E59_14580 [Amaricoccus sp.]